MKNHKEGYKLTIRVKGSLEEYAMTFLSIFNNVRENDSLLQIENYSNNDISVICLAEVKDRFKLWLEQYGEIIEEEKILCVEIEEIDFDYNKYDDVCFYVEK